MLKLVSTKQQGQKEERVLDGARGDPGCPWVLGRSGMGNSQVSLSFCVAGDGDGDGDGTAQRRCKGKLSP